MQSLLMKNQRRIAPSISLTQNLFSRLSLYLLCHTGAAAVEGEETTPEPLMPAGGSAVPSRPTSPPPLHVRSTADK